MADAAMKSARAQLCFWVFKAHSKVLTHESRKLAGLTLVVVATEWWWFNYLSTVDVASVANGWQWCHWGAHAALLPMVTHSSLLLGQKLFTRLFWPLILFARPLLWLIKTSTLAISFLALLNFGHDWCFMPKCFFWESGKKNFGLLMRLLHQQEKSLFLQEITVLDSLFGKPLCACFSTKQ